MRRATGPASLEQLSSSLQFPDGASSWASVQVCPFLMMFVALIAGFLEQLASST